jgi:hypothetical protein
MLAICSDLDETPDRAVYLEIARYLNTERPTVMGPGLGLEVGNTIYFDMAPDQFAYWNTDDAGRAMVRDLIRSGHIDCFHSFGDLATTRTHAGRTLEELDRHGCRLRTWIDHGVAPTNFGADIMKGQGDVPGAPAYHADLTCSFGVGYVWRGRVTSVTGQDVPRRLAGIFDLHHPAASARTLAKEAAKGLLGRLGSEKYALHPANEVLRPARLRDGRPVLEFLRANPYWQAVDRGGTADGIEGVLTSRMLERLIARGGLMLLYTHLGKIRRREEPFGPGTREALAGLARAYRDGRVLVTTTTRLLDHVRAVREVNFACHQEAGLLVIEARTPTGGDGLSFFVASGAPVRLRINGRDVANPLRGACGDRDCVAVPWPRLEFPAL